MSGAFFTLETSKYRFSARWRDAPSGRGPVVEVGGKDDGQSDLMLKFDLFVSGSRAHWHTYGAGGTDTVRSFDDPDPIREMIRILGFLPDTGDVELDLKRLEAGVRRMIEAHR